MTIGTLAEPEKASGRSAPTESQIEPWFALRVPRALTRPAESGVEQVEENDAEEED